MRAVLEPDGPDEGTEVVESGGVHLGHALVVLESGENEARALPTPNPWARVRCTEFRTVPLTTAVATRNLRHVVGRRVLGSVPCSGGIYLR